MQLDSLVEFHAGFFREINDHTLQFRSKVSLCFLGYAVMPSSFIWYPRKYRDAVDPKLVLLLEVNVDYNTDFRVGERRKSSGKPSDLKRGRNEQHVEKVLRPAAIGLFEVVHLGGNINNESALQVFLFKVTEQITRKSHYINGASLPLFRRNDRLVRSGLSWRTSVPTSRGSPAFL